MRAQWCSQCSSFLIICSNPAKEQELVWDLRVLTCTQTSQYRPLTCWEIFFRYPAPLSMWVSWLRWYNCDKKFHPWVRYVRQNWSMSHTFCCQCRYVSLILTLDHIVVELDSRASYETDTSYASHWNSSPNLHILHAHAYLMSWTLLYIASGPCNVDLHCEFLQDCVYQRTYAVERADQLMTMHRYICINENITVDDRATCDQLIHGSRLCSYLSRPKDVSNVNMHA